MSLAGRLLCAVAQGGAAGRGGEPRRSDQRGSRRARALVAGAILCCAAAAGAGAAQSPVDGEGVVSLPAMSVPASSFLSPEARAAYVAATRHPRTMDPMEAAAGVAALRSAHDLGLKAAVARAAELYPTSVEHAVIAGTPVLIVTPKGGVKPSKLHKVLINLHGGAFMVGGGGPGSALESIPVASVGGYRVVSVDYRLAPEHRFPAASEDVAAVYGALLKHYRADRIGLYGCSSGGTLAGQAVAWFAAKGLPRPGAVGVLCASLSPNFGGDSAYLAPPLNGNPPVSAPIPGRRWKGTGETPYMDGADLGSALAQPLGHPDVLARFPPTLFITSTRAPEMSAAIYSHAQLVKAGVDADLHVFEGLWHGFAGDVGLPEAREFTDVVVRFFDRKLAP